MQKYLYFLCFTLLIPALMLAQEQQVTIEEKVNYLKKRINNLDKQYADKEKLQKEAENDPCLGNALQRREKTIEKMKAHLNEMIAAIQDGNENKLNELKNTEKELGKELDSCNRAIFFAKQAALHRRNMKEIDDKISSEKEKVLPEDEEIKKALTELISIFESLSANPPEGYEENEKVKTIRKRLDELETLRAQRTIEQDFNSSVEKIKKQMEEYADNVEIKEAGEKLIGIYSQIKELKLTVNTARAKERAMMEEKYFLESQFYEKIKNTKKNTGEKENSGKNE